MTTNALRDFIDRHTVSASALAAVAAALDARVLGERLEPELEACVQELLASFGVADQVDEVPAEQLATLISEIRHHLAADLKLLHHDTRSTSWGYTDERFLQDVGDFARSHANALTLGAIPQLPGLTERLHKPGAAFLDVGVGVAGLAIGMAEQWPELSIVGIDVWEPALRLARQNVDVAGLGARIELRKLAAEELSDQERFDLAWLPSIFMPERIMAAATERCFRALRPGGWVVHVFANSAGIEDTSRRAFWRLRTVMWGGPLWTTAEAEELERASGFVDVRTLPAPPGVPIAMVVGRRPD